MGVIGISYVKGRFKLVAFEFLPSLVHQIPLICDIADSGAAGDGFEVFALWRGQFNAEFCFGRPQDGVKLRAFRIEEGPPS